MNATPRISHDDTIALKENGLKWCPGCKNALPMNDFYVSRTRSSGVVSRCKKCDKIRHATDRLSHPGTYKNYTKRQSLELIKHARAPRTGLPMSKSKKCADWLGIHIAENVLSYYFEDIKRASRKAPYDFVCKRGYKIDVKSSCLQYRYEGTAPQWNFNILYNTAPDYFMCLAFDNRESLTPMHVWLIPGEVVCNRSAIRISNSPHSKSLAKWKPYEGNIEKVITQCDLMKKNI